MGKVVFEEGIKEDLWVRKLMARRPSEFDPQAEALVPTFAGMILAIIKYCFYQKDDAKGSSAFQILNSVEMRPKIPQVVDAEVGRGRRYRDCTASLHAVHS